MAENWDYRVTLASRADNGFDRVNDSSDMQLFNLRSNYRFTPSDNIDYELGYSTSSRSMGSYNLAIGQINTLCDLNSASILFSHDFIGLVVQNALNDHYTEYQTDLVGKRRAYLTATLEF